MMHCWNIQFDHFSHFEQGWDPYCGQHGGSVLWDSGLWWWRRCRLSVHDWAEFAGEQQTEDRNSQRPHSTRQQEVGVVKRPVGFVLLVVEVNIQKLFSLNMIFYSFEKKTFIFYYGNFTLISSDDFSLLFFQCLLSQLWIWLCKQEHDLHRYKTRWQRRTWDFFFSYIFPMIYFIDLMLVTVKDNYWNCIQLMWNYISPKYSPNLIMSIMSIK